MPSTGEVKKTAAERKPVKEKKPEAAAKEEKSKKTATKTASHPPYFEMIKEAVLALKEKSGSSPYAIAKYMEDKHKGVLPPNFRKILGLQLKNSAAKGKLIKIKASYKLSETGKKDKAAPLVTKKTTSAAVGTKRKAEVVKKAKTVKKATPVKKKAAPVKKATPVKPKSIKSPAAKKAKKASAAA
ncbi:hypothetical protein ABFS82_08G099900 [Erythranthe guttata]|uniref:H15 domain-containing protein n=1 Tax=Erythranthe guttata TaxID=4155 RepID=A0A022PYG5_ERYGU|nr:PREDICTED: histone H1-like [Erythranthe guttata]EYU20524.1 hypothetical protein MIMGU_mgv1a014603mg [Erythranthe guttata]|eukprot:XP_012857684.1 PREDICTED: histone H1-like [Erythranthe guttata]